MSFGPAAPGNNPKAIWSLVLGIVSVATCFGLLAGIPAVILGRGAKQEITASAGQEKGEGMASAGVLLGWLSIPISLTVLFILYVSGAFEG